MNENLAREIFELHTLGVNGGYGQNDVIELLGNHRLGRDAPMIRPWTRQLPASIPAVMSREFGTYSANATAIPESSRVVRYFGTFPGIRQRHTTRIQAGSAFSTTIRRPAWSIGSAGVFSIPAVICPSCIAR